MIKFAGQFLPNYVRVNDLKYSVLAPIEHKTGTIHVSYTHLTLPTN